MPSACIDKYIYIYPCTSGQGREGEPALASVDVLGLPHRRAVRGGRRLLEGVAQRLHGRDVGGEADDHDGEPEGYDGGAGGHRAPAQLAPHRRHVQPGRHDEGDDGEGDGPEQGDHVAEVGEQDGHRARAKDRERLEAGPAVRRGLLHRQARGRGQARAHELCVQHGARGAQEQRVLREHLEHMPRGHKLKREGERDDEAEQALDQDAPHPLNVERDNALGVVPVQPIPQGAEGEEHHGEHGLPKSRPVNCNLDSFFIHAENISDSVAIPPS
mmetsp:Transcript_4860/g.15135  ORF Transcript_4860/g.15135 Transcript_4860/m.15135 type:complete len:272 (+) Transcript_4860:308-1123(+)